MSTTLRGSGEEFFDKQIEKAETAEKEAEERETKRTVEDIKDGIFKIEVIDEETNEVVYQNSSNQMETLEMGFHHIDEAIRKYEEEKREEEERIANKFR